MDRNVLGLSKFARVYDDLGGKAGEKTFPAVS